MYSGTSIMWTPLVPSKVSPSKEVSLLRRFLVGVVMHTHVVEHYKGVFQSSPLL